MAANDFKAFNSLINPNDDAIYIALSRSASGKGLPITFTSAITVLATDILAEIGVFLPIDIACIEVPDEHLVNKIASEKPNLIITKIGESYFIFARELGIKTTTCNTLVAGVSAQTYGFAKSARALLLPFKPKTNKAPRLEDAEVIWMPEKLDQLPAILKPLYKLSRPVSDTSLQYPISTDLGNTLITIYQNMSKLGYASPAKRELINYVNEELSASPMTSDELENLLTSNLLSAEISEFYGNKDQFLHNKMGDYLIREHSIKRDSSSKRLYFYDDKDKIYKTDNDVLLGIMTQLCPAIKEYQRQEVIKYLEAALSRDNTVFDTDPTKIVFKNGVLDIETMVLEPMSEKHLETIQVNCNYNPKAKSPTADEFFATATCEDSDIENLLYEAIGYSMLKTNELQKAFLLVGNGRNGKSTYFDVIKEVLGKKNITTVSFKDLSGSFRASSLDGKLASLAGDISAQPIQDSDLFKSITAGEDVLLEKKFEQAYEKALFSTMFFAANSLPRTPDTSDGFFRRFCIIPFNADLKKVSRVDGMLFKKRLLSKESIEYIAYKAVTAISKVLTTTFDFTKSSAVEEMLQKYKIANSSVLSWFYDEKNGKASLLCDGQTTSQHYASYKSWCISNSFGTCKSSNFIEQLKQHCDMKVNFMDKFVMKENTLFDFVEVETDEPLPFSEEELDPASDDFQETIDNFLK